MGSTDDPSALARQSTLASRRWRCEAVCSAYVKPWRCSRFAVVEINGRKLCKQHGRQEAGVGGV